MEIKRKKVLKVNVLKIFRNEKLNHFSLEHTGKNISLNQTDIENILHTKTILR